MSSSAAATSAFTAPASPRVATRPRLDAHLRPPRAALPLTCFHLRASISKLGGATAIAPHPPPRPARTRWVLGERAAAHRSRTKSDSSLSSIVRRRSTAAGSPRAATCPGRGATQRGTAPPAAAPVAAPRMRAPSPASDPAALRGVGGLTSPTAPASAMRSCTSVSAPAPSAPRIAPRHRARTASSAPLAPAPWEPLPPSSAAAAATRPRLRAAAAASAVLHARASHRGPAPPRQPREARAWDVPRVGRAARWAPERARAPAPVHLST